MPKIFCEACELCCIFQRYELGGQGNQSTAIIKFFDSFPNNQLRTNLLTFLAKTCLEGLELGMQFRICSNEHLSSCRWWKSCRKCFDIINELDEWNTTFILPISNRQQTHILQFRSILRCVFASISHLCFYLVDPTGIFASAKKVVVDSLGFQCCCFWPSQTYTSKFFLSVTTMNEVVWSTLVMKVVSHNIYGSDNVATAVCLASSQCRAAHRRESCAGQLLPTTASDNTGEGNTQQW